MSVRIVAAAVAAALFAAVSPLSAGLAGEAGIVAAERITVAVEGRGPDVILVPGLASSPEVWRGITDQLRKTHRLHLVQLAGFAGAPASAEGDGPVAAPAAEAIANYIAHERLKAPAIIGHSLGGEVALMVAARHPDRVGRGWSSMRSPSTAFCWAATLPYRRRNLVPRHFETCCSPHRRSRPTPCRLRGSADL